MCKISHLSPSDAAPRPLGTLTVSDQAHGKLCEESLTRVVPLLLEAMNSASTEQNNCELRATEVRQRHSRRLAELEQLRKELNHKSGKALERVQPYFDAAERLKATSMELQAIGARFSAASADSSEANKGLQELESRIQFAPERELHREHTRVKTHAQQLEEECERQGQAYAETLTLCRAAKEELERLRVSIGDDAISRTMPSLLLLKEKQEALDADLLEAGKLAEAASAAKARYGHAMRELEYISDAVHAVRQRRGAVAAAAAGAPGAAEE